MLSQAQICSLTFYLISPEFNFALGSYTAIIPVFWHGGHWGYDIKGDERPEAAGIGRLGPCYDQFGQSLFTINL